MVKTNGIENVLVARMTVRRWVLVLIVVTLVMGIGGYLVGERVGRSEAIEGGAETVMSAVQQKMGNDPAARTVGQGAFNRDKAKVASASNLRQIGLAMIMYNNSHLNGPLPKSLDELARDQELTAKALISPVTGKRLVLIPRLLTAPQTDLMGYDDMLPEGANVLFADAHVEWVNPKYFKEILAKGGQ